MITAEPLKRVTKEVDIRDKYWKMAEDIWCIIFWIGVIGYFYLKQMIKGVEFNSLNQFDM